MTSLLSSYKLGNTLPNPTGCVVLTYNDGTNDVPVPFIFDRRTSILDIKFDGTASGFDENTTMQTNDTKFFRGQTFNTLYTINGIGPNFIEWLENEGGATAGTVQIHEKPIIVPANVVQVNGDPNNWNSMETSTTPISFETANGGPSNDYYATYLFKKPLVVKYTVTPTSPNLPYTEYRAFMTQFEGNT